MKTATRLTLLLLALLLACGMLAACADVETTGAWEEATYTSDKEFGKGEKTVTVLVTAEEQTLTFILHTDKAMLGDALMEHDLIEGEEGAFGLYVKRVNGILADYDVDQTYWQLTKGGELMMVGVDGAEIADGEQYELTKAK